MGARKFNEQTNVAPRGGRRAGGRNGARRSALAFVHERVLREACRRLIYIAAPVSTLAFELGFEDPAYFCRFFKRHTGLSPREYRLRQAETQGLR